MYCQQHTQRIFFTITVDINISNTAHSLLRSWKKILKVKHNYLALQQMWLILHQYPPVIPALISLIWLNWMKHGQHSRHQTQPGRSTSCLTSRRLRDNFGYKTHDPRLKISQGHASWVPPGWYVLMFLKHWGLVCNFGGGHVWKSFWLWMPLRHRIKAPNRPINRHNMWGEHVAPCSPYPTLCNCAILFRDMAAYQHYKLATATQIHVWQNKLISSSNLNIS